MGKNNWEKNENTVGQKWDKSAKIIFLKFILSNGWKNWEKSKGSTFNMKDDPQGY